MSKVQWMMGGYLVVGGFNVLLEPVEMGGVGFIRPT